MIQENKDIREVNTIHEIVDCIGTNVYGKAPSDLIDAFNMLPNDNYSNYLRTLAVPFLFHLFEKHVTSEGNPIIWFSNSLNELKVNIEDLSKDKSSFIFLKSCFEQNVNINYNKEVKSHTGQHYGNLFKEFDHKSYFNEAKELLKTRLDRNNIVISNLSDLTLLDQGCGGGRYTTAWRLLGAKKAVGLDFSEIGLNDARLRAETANIENVEFIHGSVLDMPFENESFDIVFSNGVLHHTEDWRKGIYEQMRVMKSGGWGWQYLIENPGGIFWDKIEILRAIMKDVNKEFAQNILKSLGIPNNRVFYMLDHVMVPINTRVSDEELVKELTKNGAINIQRLNRGTDFDRVEAIYKKVPFAKEKFGVGEHRYIFNKM
jgi:ubiquinone/menaquinone biosynthesis C-methylase UbiE